MQLSGTLLNPFSSKIWACIIKKYPNWQPYLGIRDKDDLEVAVPAPPGSKAGHLIIFTTSGKDLWIRFALPYMCYPIDGLDEMLSVIKLLLDDDTCMVAIAEDNEWVETTLARAGQ